MNNIMYDFDENNYSKNSQGSTTLEQGVQFKKYQKKIKKSVDTSLVREGFASASQYNLLLQESKDLQKTYIDYSKSLIDVASPDNKYHNKNVRFTNTGTTGYVTDVGQLKLYPNNETFQSTAGKNGCGTTTLTDISGDFGSLTYGKIIKTNPSLFVGTPMIQGQTCGSEGSNVRVKTILPTSIKPPTYLGCYTDVLGSNSTSFIGDYPTNQKKGSYTYNTCKDAAISGSYRYFGLQNVDPTTGKGYCAVSITSPGDLTSGTPIWSSETAGKTGSSAILTNKGSLSIVKNNLSIYSTPVPSTSSSDVYYLILQDDANLCIYSGTGPNDNRGLIWQSKTSGSQGGPNSRASSANGKYGKNNVSIGFALAPGEFLGSNDGSSYLIMQNDGNLVLYKSKTATSCSKMNDTNMGGGVETNAMYDIGLTGFPKTLGKVGYIDYDGNLFEYESPTNLLPPGDSLEITDIDSFQWNKYNNSGKYVTSNTFNSSAMFNTPDRSKINDINSKLNKFAGEISENTNDIIGKNINVANKITNNNSKFSNNQGELSTISKTESKKLINNIEGILKDSDIVVLHENYKYILFSILAVAVVSVSLNLLKK